MNVAHSIEIVFLPLISACKEKLASPFGHLKQVSKQVQLAAIRNYLQVHLARV